MSHQPSNKPANPPFGPYSPVCQAGDLYFISGQVGVNSVNKQAPQGIEQQTELLLINLEQALLEAGLTKKNIVKTTVFLRDMADFAIVNQLYMTYFAEPRPARSCVAVAELPRIGDQPLLIELEAIAWKSQAA